MLTPRTRTVVEDADLWIVFTGPPNKTVHWTLVGPGVLSYSSMATDVNGVAKVKYTPGVGSAGEVATISVTYRREEE